MAKKSKEMTDDEVYRKKGVKTDSFSFNPAKVIYSAKTPTYNGDIVTSDEKRTGLSSALIIALIFVAVAGPLFYVYLANSAGPNPFYPQEAEPENRPAAEIPADKTQQDNPEAEEGQAQKAPASVYAAVERLMRNATENLYTDFNDAGPIELVKDRAVTAYGTREKFQNVTGIIFACEGLSGKVHCGEIKVHPLASQMVSISARCVNPYSWKFECTLTFRPYPPHAGS